MTQLFRPNGPRPGPVPSPCISICRMDAQTGLCEGCLRTLDEIADWGAMPDARRRTVLEAVDARRAAIEAADHARFDEPAPAARGG
ncbi:DUF1289 domain-containing protein [Quisquiliibacterium transsilvanicum]|uniref:DUF1289 domain-containing protein n=1 Tax=Quisquiliibacterium transsilvanicum TaxID=1549638 RepID=A0A7W8HLM2_9BURK|nr:DUF1289 domain-containing protein [Quisquiliibacterium transsilvanicum]MBB5273383.1 hypothetical protein [Quisquiliibacterium transsilvanicum]